MRICDLLNLTEGKNWGSMSPKAAYHLLGIYNELAPHIEKYHDDQGADRLYKEMTRAAAKYKESNTFDRMLAVARNSAHMEYDTNPGHFKNWFWFLEDMLEKIAATDHEEGGIEIGQES